MRTVITISLNGTAYQLEAPAYDALRAYLQVAEQRLADNPDMAEIIADLEQAIADKCARYLGPHKNVISADEVAQVIREMGPVDGGEGHDGVGAATSTGTESAPSERSAASQQPPADQPGVDGAAGPAPKRLYQIREGAVISGVCNGLAAYLNIDVAILRVLFVVLAIVTGGVWVLVYIVMMFVIPYAQTSEQHAAAHGWPFNAEELIGRAKTHYSEFKDGKHWRRKYRDQRRMWKYQRKQWRQEARAWQRWGGPGVAPPPPPPSWSDGQSASGPQAPPNAHYAPSGAPYASTNAHVPENAHYAAQVLGGVLTPITALVGAVLFLAFLFALVSLVTRHSILGWPLPAEIPLWLGIVILAVLYRAVVAPLRAARYAGYSYGRPFAHGVLAMWGALLWIGFVSLLAWLAWHHWPEVRDFVQQLTDTVRSAIEHHPAPKLPGDSV